MYAPAQLWEPSDLELLQILCPSYPGDPLGENSLSLGTFNNVKFCLPNGCIGLPIQILIYISLMMLNILFSFAIMYPLKPGLNYNAFMFIYSIWDYNNKMLLLKEILIKLLNYVFVVFRNIKGIMFLEREFS